MIPHQSQLDRIEQEISAREVERSTYWQTGAFSLRGMRYTQELISHLPNTRTEALAALKKHGKGADVAPDLLHLTAIGWNDRPLAHINETQRRELVAQAIARLDDIKDPQLLASARLVAESLPDYRARYEERVSSLAAWAAAHTDEIFEQEHV